MAPTPLAEVRRHVERVQSTFTDPAEKDRALSVVERELNDLIGVVRTYRNDARLQGGDAGSPNGNGQQPNPT